MSVYARALRAFDYGFRMPTAPVRRAPLPAPDRPQTPWRWIAAGGCGVVQRLVARHRVSQQLRAANAPVLLTHTRSQARYRRVLVPVDFSVASLAAARQAAGMDAQLVFMGQFMPEQGASNAAQTATEQGEATRAQLAQLVERLDIPHALVSVIARSGTLDSAARAYADLMRADLIVIGRRDIPRIERFLLGELEWELFRKTGCDLLVVPE